jgi:hypothetical protein
MLPAKQPLPAWSIAVPLQMLIASGCRSSISCSTWVTINAESRRLAKIPENVKQRFLQLAPSPPRCAIPTSDTRRKLPEFVWPPQVRLLQGCAIFI